MEYLKHLFSNTILTTLIIMTLSIGLSGQLDYYPDTDNDGGSLLQLKNYGVSHIDFIALDEDADAAMPFTLGSKIYMYKNNVIAPNNRRVTLNASTGTEGGYGSLRLDAYSNVTPLLNANNVATSGAAPYAMISLAKRESSFWAAAQDYSWNIGVYDEFEYDSLVSSQADAYDCQNCLTFAYQDGAGGAFYKFSFGSDADFQTASDERLKENIEDVNNTLDKIIELSPKKYHYIWGEKNPNRKNSGFLAQDVQKIFPELVTSIKQPNGEKTLMLNYTGMIPYITKGMQEQQEIISDQESTINNLQAQLNQLSAQVKELKEIMKN